MVVLVLDIVIWVLVAIVALNLLFFGVLYFKYILDLWKEKKGNE